MRFVGAVLVALVVGGAAVIVMKPPLADKSASGKPLNGFQPAPRWRPPENPAPAPVRPAFEHSPPSSHSDDQMRQMAADLQRQAANVDTAAAIVAQMREYSGSDERLLGALASSLAQNPLPDSIVASLVPLLQDSSRPLRQKYAALALSTNRSESAVRALIDLLRTSTREDTQAVAAAGLRWEKAGSLPPTLRDTMGEALMDQLAHNPSARVRAVALEALTHRQLPDRLAVQVIEIAKAEPNPKARVMMLQKLEGLGPRNH